MGRTFTFDIPDLAGGLNESAAANIQDREMATLASFYVEGASVFSRPGMEKWVTGTYAQKVLSIARYNPGYTSEEYLLLGCAASIARVVGDAIEALQVADGRIYPTLDARWWHAQYNDEMFWCRRGNGGVKRVYGDSVQDAGIAAPTTAPVAVDGGPGKKEAGTYRLAYRFYNTLTGARSNWSPWSHEVTIEAAHRLSMSGIEASGSAQVNARQIGATRISNGVMYVVGQINDNVTTVFSENASDDEYGEADAGEGGAPKTDVRHGTPPDQAWALAVHKERLFVLNGDGIFYGEPGWMQSFKSTSYAPVQKGTGLLSWQDHGLVITTELNAQVLLGDTPSDWRTDTGNLSKEHGCPSGKSLVVADGVLYYYTGVNLVRSDGAGVVILPGLERVRATLDAIPEDEKDDVSAVTVPSRGWVIFNVPQPLSTRKAIVYDYKNNVFQTFPSSIPVFAMERLGQPDQAEAVLAAGYQGAVSTLYEFLSGTDDDGTAIAPTLKTKSFGYDRGIGDKVTRHVSLLTNQVNGTVTIKVYHDDVLAATRAGLSLNSKGWKRFVMATAGTPGALVAVEIVYAGSAQLRIDQIQIDGVNLMRRVVPV